MIDEQEIDIKPQPIDEYEERLVEWLNQRPFSDAAMLDTDRQAELDRLRAAKEIAWQKRQQAADASDRDVARSGSGDGGRDRD